MSNPLSLVYDGIWDLVEGFQPFKDKFKKNNIIRLDGELRDPIKNNLQTADLPEVIMLFAGGEGNFHSTSSTSDFTQRFDFIINTGQKRVGMVADLKWFAFQSMHKWRLSLGALQYADETFVMGLDYVSHIEGLSDVENNRNIKGWSTVLSVACPMRFSRAQMEKVV